MPTRLQHAGGIYTPTVCGAAKFANQSNQHTSPSLLCAPQLANHNIWSFLLSLTSWVVSQNQDQSQYNMKYQPSPVHCCCCALSIVHPPSKTTAIQQPMIQVSKRTYSNIPRLEIQPRFPHFFFVAFFSHTRRHTFIDERKKFGITGNSDTPTPPPLEKRHVRVQAKITRFC